MAKKKNKRWILEFDLITKGEDTIGESYEFSEVISIKLGSHSLRKAMSEAHLLWNSLDWDTILSHSKYKKAISNEDAFNIFNPKLVFSEKCDFVPRMLSGLI